MFHNLTYYVVDNYYYFLELFGNNRSVHRQFKTDQGIHALQLLRCFENLDNFSSQLYPPELRTIIHANVTNVTKMNKETVANLFKI